MRKCRKCSREAAEGHAKCDHCLALKRANSKKRRESFISDGACSECGGTRDDVGRKMCSECRSRIKARQRKRYQKCKSDNTCYRCGAPADKKFCNRCHALAVKWNKDKRDALRAAGKCTRCSSERDTPAGDFCSHCILRGTAGKWLGSVKHTDDLKQLLEEQKFECPYSGKRLELGGNACIDHKTPRSRGGPDRLKNLQWVDDLINRSKTDMTHEEFVAMCRLVASRFPE